MTYLLAEFARSVGFVPTAEERLVFRGATADATLDSLRGELAQVAPEWRGRLMSWAELSEADRDELEALVEKAIDQPDYFKTRRGERSSGLQIGKLTRRAQDGSPRRSLMPEGSIALPAGLLDDVHRGNLLPVDLAVLTTFLLTLQSRKLHPAREHYVSFDGDTLLVRDGGRALLSDWDPGGRIELRSISSTFAAIMGRLSQRRWLAVEKSSNAVRVRLGARLTADVKR
jgi:hypothetical protein